MFGEHRELSVAVLLAGVAAVSALAVSSASAQSVSLSSVLGEVEWGDSKETVLDKLKSEMMEDLRSREDLEHDRVALQRARSEAMDEVESIEESYTKLEGEETPYDVSVVADEFSRNKGESLLRTVEDNAQRFYFFVDGELYKLVVAYKRKYLRNIGFEAFVRQVEQKYGSLESTTYEPVAGDETLVLAEWKSEETSLRVENEKEYFGTYTMSFADRDRLEQLKAEREDFGGRDDEESQVSDRVKALATDSEESEGGGGDTLGASISVDLGGEEGEGSGRDTEEPGGKQEGAETATASEPSESGGDEDESAAPSPTAGGGADGTGGAESDESDEGDGEDEDLVIY